MSTRFYVPGDWAGLHETVAVSRQMVAQGLGPLTTRFRGHVVTDALRAALPELDDEALEDYVATEAAQESLRFFSDEGEPARRLVVVFEVTALEPVADSLTLAHPAAGLAVPEDVVAWLVDTEAAAEDVDRAASALWSVQGQEWSEETRDAVEACLDHQLAWYAATETDEVLGLS